MIVKENISKIIPYVPGKLKEGAIKLASNENPLGPSPKAIEALKNGIADINLYPDGSCEKLKNRLAQKYSVGVNEIVVGNGSDEILQFIAGAYIDKGFNAVTSQASFPEYNFVVNLFNGEIRSAEMVRGTFSLENILKLIDEKTRVVFLCNPNNPTGTYFTKQDLESFMPKVSKNVLVVIDEAYFEYVHVDDYPNSLELLDTYNNIMVLRTFSKIFGLAGLRVGYGIANESVINALNKAREPFNVNLLAQRAAVAAIDDSEFVEKSKEQNIQEKEFLYSHFEKMGIKYYESQANFVFFFIEKDCMKVFQELMELGVTVRPMKPWGKECIRVTCGTREQNEFFIEKLKSVLKK